MDSQSVYSEPIFPGSNVSIEDFHAKVQTFKISNNLSKKCEKELFALLDQLLPKPNAIFTEKRLMSLPVVTTFEHEEGKLLCVDVRDQITSLIRRNKHYIEKSWRSSDKSPLITGIPPVRGEVHLVINMDGVPLFKSRKLSVWPFWLQCFNLPPKLRSAFQNISLLAIWYGSTKPNWSRVLSQVKFELEALMLTQEDTHLGNYRCKILFLVCDMPAKAAALNMNQFNGFNGCTHCLLIGTRKGARMIYPCDAAIKLRDSASFKRHSEKAELKGEVVAGIKGSSPLSSVLNFPDDAPVDVMHQVFLGTGKTLSKMFLKALRPVELKEFNSFLKNALIPAEFLRKPKDVAEMNFWKAGDFKVLFFHLIPLSFDLFLRVDRKKIESFYCLSLAIRILSGATVVEDILSAELLMEKFFKSFVELYGEELQSYNFHSMRHLCNQVRRLGPLWNCSAFGFESANHFLVRHFLVIIF